MIYKRLPFMNMVDQMGYPTNSNRKSIYNNI